MTVDIFPGDGNTLEYELLAAMYDRVVGGLPLLGAPDRVAGEERDRAASTAEAADRLGRRYAALCGAAGFAFGLPGYGAMPVTVPSNIMAVTALQLHLAASIAALGGRNPLRFDVRDRCIECVTGAPEDGPAARELDSVGGRIVGKLGERGLRYLGEQAGRWVGEGARGGGRNLPLLGGFVGAVADGRSTRSVAGRARAAFLD